MDDSSQARYDNYLKKEILRMGKHGITAIENLSSTFKTIPYNPANLRSLVQALTTGAGQQYDEQWPEFRAYLDVFTFIDQEGRSYYVIVYDSDELMQNPAIMDIIENG
jgi:hypothetical protein